MDIVTRLRTYAVAAHDGPPLHPVICDEAAADIERLEAALAIARTALLNIERRSEQARAELTMATAN